MITIFQTAREKNVTTIKFHNIIPEKRSLSAKTKAFLFSEKKK